MQERDRKETIFKQKNGDKGKNMQVRERKKNVEERKETRNE